MKTPIMLRVFPLLCLLLFSSLSHAQASTTYYQVDLIVFAHAYTEGDQLETSSQVRVPHHMQSAISLKPREPGVSGVYRLMPTSTSSLQSSWNRLNQHSQYRVLFHYTWIQPSNNQRPVLLPSSTNNGWTVEGTVRVRQSNYYLLDTALQFKTPNGRHSTFLFEQKQRLKPGNTYYLDHPQAGMLINVHRVG